MKKGKTNNPNGRPKGKPNRTTQEMREWIQKILDSNTELLEKDLVLLDPMQRWQICERLLQYLLPKVQAAEFAQVEEKKISIFDELNRKLLKHKDDEDEVFGPNIYDNLSETEIQTLNAGKSKKSDENFKF